MNVSQIEKDSKKVKVKIVFVVQEEKMEYK